MARQMFLDDDIWALKKMEILDGIDAAMEKGSVDKDLLDIMKELLSSCKVKVSMKEYFEED
jgi:tRNA(Phe) wybutosine-synthesizing methylase Tyw3